MTAENEAKEPESITVLKWAIQNIDGQVANKKEAQDDAKVRIEQLSVQIARLEADKTDIVEALQVLSTREILQRGKSAWAENIAKLTKSGTITIGDKPVVHGEGKFSTGSEDAS